MWFIRDSRLSLLVEVSLCIANRVLFSLQTGDGTRGVQHVHVGEDGGAISEQNLGCFGIFFEGNICFASCVRPGAAGGVPPLVYLLPDIHRLGLARAPLWPTISAPHWPSVDQG